MNDWARRRKRIVLLIVLAIVVFLIAIPGYFIFHRSPTCSDGKMNGDETGIDCGGGCRLLCTSESLPLVSRGDPRVISVASTTYEVVAVFQNPNASASIARAGYVIKLWDDKTTVPIKSFEGETLVPRNSMFAVFVGPFNLEAGTKSVRATFEWKAETLVWQKDMAEIPNIAVKSKTLSATTTAPRLDAEVQNNSLSRVANIELVAILTDEGGNIFAASRTIIDAMQPGQVVPVVFNWPRPFSKTALDIKIIPRIFPDRSFIR